MSRVLIDEPCPTASTTKRLTQYTCKNIHRVGLYLETLDRVVSLRVCSCGKISKKYCMCTSWTCRQEYYTSVPEALLLALFPSLSHIISVDMMITHRALWRTRTREVRCHVCNKTTIPHDKIHRLCKQIISCLSPSIPLSPEQDQAQQLLLPLSSLLSSVQLLQNSWCSRFQSTSSSLDLKCATLTVQYYFPSLCASHLNSRLHLLLPGECL